MFSIPIAIMEDIYLNYSLFLPSPSSPLALPPSLNLVFMMSVCCHGSYSVTDVLWLHCRIEAEENLGWENNSEVNLQRVSSAKYSLHLYVVLFFKKRYITWCFVEGRIIFSVIEITPMSAASIQEWLYCSLTLGLWKLWRVWWRLMCLILHFHNAAEPCSEHIDCNANFPGFLLEYFWYLESGMVLWTGG